VHGNVTLESIGYGGETDLASDYPVTADRQFEKDS
jgi:hypothetical protein